RDAGLALPLQSELPDIRIWNSDQRCRLLRGADERGADVCAQCADRLPPVDLSRRPLHARGRRQGAPVPRRLREALRLQAAPLANVAQALSRDLFQRRQAPADLTANDSGGPVVTVGGVPFSV